MTLEEEKEAFSGYEAAYHAPARRCGDTVGLNHSRCVAWRLDRAVRKGVSALRVGLLSRVESALNKMTNLRWASWQSVENEVCYGVLEAMCFSVTNKVTFGASLVAECLRRGDLGRHQAARSSLSRLAVGHQLSLLL